MGRILDELSDPARRAAIRAVWMDSGVPSLTTDEGWQQYQLGPLQLPEERSYERTDDPLTRVVWEIRVPYPKGVGEVGGLLLVTAEGEPLAGAGAAREWSTIRFGGSAEVILELAEAYPWPAP